MNMPGLCHGHIQGVNNFVGICMLRYKHRIYYCGHICYLHRTPFSRRDQAAQTKQPSLLIGLHINFILHITI